MTADERYTKTRAVLLAALMVVSVAGGSIAFAGTAAAATITVDDDAGSGDYSSIQTALDNAATGDTITVAAGTYQPFTVSTADVTVQSATGAMPVVDGSGSSTVVTIDADGVTLAGFEIVGDSATKDGVAITGDRAGITVKNNVIHGMAKADAGSGGIDGATYAIHNWGGALDGVVVRNNEIYDVGTTGYNDGDGTSDGDGAEPQVISLGPFEGADSVIRNNQISNVVDDGVASYGILLYDGDATATANVQVTGNALGNAIYDVYSYGAGAPTINGLSEGSAQVESLYEENSEVDRVFANGADSTTHTVAQSGSPDFGDISTALSNADADDRIVVTDGATYSPFTVSTTGVDVVAADGVQPTIDGSGSSSVVTIAADHVVLDGFEIVGDSATKDGVAITGDRTGVTVSNNVIHGMAKADAGSGGIDGATYAIHNWGGALDGVVVRNNEIYDVGTTGYNDGDGTSDGDGAEPQVLSLGPFAGADSVVSGNTLYDIQYDGTSSYGILLYEDGDGTTANVQVTGNDVGTVGYDVISYGADAAPINGETTADAKIQSLFESNTGMDHVSVDGTTESQTDVTADLTEANSPANYDVTFISNNGQSYVGTVMEVDLSDLGTDASGVDATDLTLMHDGQELTINEVTHPDANTLRVDFGTTTIESGDTLSLTSTNREFVNPGTTGTGSVDVAVHSAETMIESGTDTVEITADTVPAVDSVTVDGYDLQQSLGAHVDNADAEAGTSIPLTINFDQLMDTSVAPTVEITGLPTTGTVSVSGSYVDATTWEGTFTVPDNDEDVVATVEISGAQDDEGNTMADVAIQDLTVDTDEPKLTVMEPSEPISGTYDLTQLISADHGTLNFDYSTDGGDTWTSLSQDVTTLDTTTLPDGELVVKLTASDGYNTPSAQTTVQVDNPPSAVSLALSSSSGTITVEVTADEQLDGIAVDLAAGKALPAEAELDGTPSTSLSRSDFTESVSEGTYTYTATWTPPRDGEYQGTLVSVTDTGGNMVEPGTVETQAVDTAAPTATNAFISAADGTSTTVEVRFSEPVAFAEGIGTGDVGIAGVDQSRITGVTAADEHLAVTVSGELSTGDAPDVTVAGAAYHEEYASMDGTAGDGAATAVHTTHLTLAAGQNFVSVPAETGSLALSEVDTSQVNTIWTYDQGQWLSYVPGEAPDDFTSLQGGQGYIFVMDARDLVDVNVQNTLSTSGGTPSLPGQVQLEEGWNLVGHWQEGQQPRSVAFGSISDAVFQVYEQDGDNFASVGTEEPLLPGESYWVFVTEDTVYGPADYQNLD